MTTNAVILAAGQGTRMHSSAAKALIELGGVPLVEHVVRAVENSGLKSPWVVVGFQAERVEEALEGRVQTVVQSELKGTGHALATALRALPKETEQAVVLLADGPLVPPEMIQMLIAEQERTGAAVTMVTARLDDPTGYGRVVRRPDGQIAAVIEEKEADDQIRQICEVNTGIGIWRVSGLLPVLEQLPFRGQEQYLTEAVATLIAQGEMVQAVEAKDPGLVMGINTRRELAAAESRLRQMTINRLFDHGVSIVDPASTFIDAEVEVGQDTIIYPMTVLRGKCRIGKGCRLGPGTSITASRLGDDVTVERSVVEQSVIGNHSTVGPFSHLRAGSLLDREVHVGNFVELKNTRVGMGTKMGHHSYLGDATVGIQVNIGAGTVVVNYDGHEKHQTFVGDQAFIGCNSNLVAPLEIGSGAYIAAGSTITKNVPAESLAIARNRQEVKPGWAKDRR